MYSIRKKSAFFVAVALVGTMLTMFHYHSEGLECLTHQQEQHFTQNELSCPYTGLIAIVDGVGQPVFDGILSGGAFLIKDVSPLYLSTQPFVPLLGRAPPFIS